MIGAMNEKILKLAEMLREAESVCLFTHTNMDGDALGSCAALCGVLRSMGKSCWILLEDTVADNLKFLDKGYTSYDHGIIQSPDVCMCLDAGETSRFPERAEAYRRGKVRLCLDHHRSTVPEADYSYVDPEASATGELVYDLIKALGVKPDAETAAAIFAAITTDTGSFQYSNTRRRCFEIAAELMDSGLDVNAVCNEIYQSNPMEQIVLSGRVLNSLSKAAGGRAVIGCVTQALLDECGAKMEHTEGIVATMRSIAGVEISVFLKEKEKNVIKVSMRSKEYADVAAICEKHGGGGHVRAAGCTLYMSMEEAVALMTKEAEAALA